jgi:hypothetical protein
MISLWGYLFTIIKKIKLVWLCCDRFFGSVRRAPLVLALTLDLLCYPLVIYIVLAAPGFHLGPASMTGNNDVFYSINEIRLHVRKDAFVLYM